MADSKISALTPIIPPLAGTEQLAVVQGGLTKRALISDITTLLSTQNQRQRQVFQVTQNTVDDLTTTQDPWPSVNQFSVAIPSWATRAIVIAVLSNLSGGGTCNHFIQVSLGSVNGSSQHIRWVGTSGNADGVVGNHSRQQYVFVEPFNVTAIHGTTVPLRTHGGRFGGSGFIRSGLDTPSEPVVHSMDIEFFQV